MNGEIVGNETYPDLVGLRSAEPMHDYVVHLTFTDNSSRDVDLEPYLHGPIYEPIRSNRKLFLAMTVDHESQTLTWPNGADIDPDVLYYTGDPPWVTAPEQAQAVV